MKDSVAVSSDLESFQPRYLKKDNREWPFPGYSQQMQKLREYFGQELLMSRTGFDSMNSREYSVMGFFNINAPYLQIGNEYSIYPHSLVFSDGSATNMKSVGFIGLDKRLGKQRLKFDPFFIIGEDSRQKIKEAKTILRDNAIYWNPVIFRNSISEAIESVKMTREMSEKAAAMGMFDED